MTTAESLSSAPWTWLPEYGFGVVTKVDRAEAFRPLAILQSTPFGACSALLAAAAIAVFVFTCWWPD